MARSPGDRVTKAAPQETAAIQSPATEDSLELHFDDPRLFTDLLGQHDAHVRTIEQALGVRVGVSGTSLRISGAHDAQALAGKVLGDLYDLLKNGYPIYPSDVEYAIRILRGDRNAELKDIFLDTVYVSAHKRVISPKSVNQKVYIDAIRSHDIVFGIGPAGTGKTYLAMAMALAALMKNQVTRMVLCRPAVEAGERLGFLPGDLAEKVNPYLRPLYDALHDMVDFDRARRMLERGTIEVAPLAFMRGRTLNDSFIILDEAQNTTSEQMKMFLTRLGYNSKAVITGDITQIDLPSGKLSGLKEARIVLGNTTGIRFVHFTDTDVVRHRLVQSIINAYESFSAERPIAPSADTGGNHRN
jgi:phosphate starvation-inducible protein PhoH and related proteins